VAGGEAHSRLHFRFILTDFGFRIFDFGFKKNDFMTNDYKLLDPRTWPNLPTSITAQAYEELTIDEQILYEACGQEQIRTNRGFMLDEGLNNPGYDVDDDEES
jgi:hypothetical protein